MSLSRYIRHVALEGKLPVPDRDETGKALSHFSRELDDLIAELGRQGGMLKLGMKPNQERKTQDPEGWSDIVLLYLYCCAGRKGRAWPSLRHIAGLLEKNGKHGMDMAKSTVCRALGLLRRLQAVIRLQCRNSGLLLPIVKWLYIIS